MTLAEAIAARYFLQGAANGPRRPFWASLDLRCSHLTRYRYEAPVAVNVCVLRLLPRQDGQRVARRDARGDAAPAGRSSAPTPSAIASLNLRIETPHRELTHPSRSRVVVERPSPPLAALTPAWEDVAARAAAAASLDADSPAAAIYPSRLAPLFAAATDYARVSFPPRRPIHEGAADLVRRIKADSSTIGGDRGLDLAGRSFRAQARRLPGLRPCDDRRHARPRPAGGLCQRLHPHHPAAGQAAPRRRGRLARLGLGVVRPRIRLARPRPDQAITAGDDHIVVAIGRDYADVSPVEGVIVASGAHALEVEVDVIPV